MARPEIIPNNGGFDFTVGKISGTLQVIDDTVVVNAQVNAPANAADQAPFPIVLAEDIVLTGVQAEHIIDYLGTI
jgi:hypothetical protein